MHLCSRTPEGTEGDRPPNPAAAAIPRLDALWIRATIRRRYFCILDFNSVAGLATLSLFTQEPVLPHRIAILAKWALAQVSSIAPAICCKSLQWLSNIPEQIFIRPICLRRLSEMDSGSNLHAAWVAPALAAAAAAQGYFRMVDVSPI